MDGVELEAGEALALLAGNAFSTGQAALAVADARRFVEWLDVAAALDFEAFGANISALHPEVAAARPYPGIAETIDRMRALLDGSTLWNEGEARFLQDPLTFRCVPQVHGAARDALRFVEAQLAVELNAHQGNPLVVASEGRLVSVGNFDSQPLATALDLLRIALAPVLTAAVERTLKLLSPRFSGLTEGLVATEGSWQDGLSELGVAAQAIAAEARLLAQPVSFELVSTMQESGVEDRAALSSLGARRAAEMLDLGARVVAIELAVAAQAIDLRKLPRLGDGTAATHSLIRATIPFLDSPERMPLPLEELARALRTSAARRSDDLRPPPAPLARAVRRGAAAAVGRHRRSTAASCRPSRARFAFDLAEHDLEHRVPALDRDGIDVAVVSLQPSLGLERCPTRSARSSRRPGRPAAEVVATSRRTAPRVRPGRRPRGLRGRLVGSSALLDLERATPLLDALARRRVRSRLRAPGRGGEPPTDATAVVGLGDRLHGPDAGGVPRLARLRSGALAVRCRFVFAILAGGAPFQLERLARRGVDVRSALDPNTFFDVSTYGRRAIELCIETFGVGQLVYGSDTPVVDPAADP